jgi:hypothetical protein
MEENNNQETKEMTIGDLAQIVTKGFEQVDKGFKESREHTKKLIDKKIEWLARNTQNNFLSIEGRLDGIESDIKEIKSNTETNKAEINKKVDVVIHNELVYRVEKVEEKLQLKPKLKFA